MHKIGTKMACMSMGERTLRKVQNRHTHAHTSMHICMHAHTWHIKGKQSKCTGREHEEDVLQGTRCSWCVQRCERSQNASDNTKQCRPTLSTAFTSNPQDLTRYSTMDSLPSWAAQCKAVYPASSESKRWPSILGARYSATARWPPTVHR